MRFFTTNHLPFPASQPYPPLSSLSLTCALSHWLGWQANRAHTYLGKRESEWHESRDEADIYPNFVDMAKSFGVPSRRVIAKSELRAAMREMLDTPGPYLLEVMVPHIEHVLPMIPGGASFKEIITEGDGSVKY